jgi:FtsZ-binding cell division protein ZapB
MALLQAKEVELAEALSQKSALESRLESQSVRDKTWERKLDKLEASRKAAETANQSLRVEIAQLKQDNQALVHRASRAAEQQSELERQASARQSALADAALAQRSETESAQAQLAALTQTLAATQSAHASTLASLKQKHSLELDSIQSRIEAVLSKKDEQLAAMKLKAQAHSDKVKEMERFMQEQLG